MNKSTSAIVLAALLGMAATTTITGWTYPAGGNWGSISSADWFSMSYITELDIGYNTLYNG